MELSAMFKYAITTVAILCLFMCKPAPKSVEKQVVNIVAEDVHKKLLAGNTIVIDVRTPDEIADGKIDGALEIDYRLADFKTKIAELDRSKEYVIYCRSGGRSKKATKIMNELQFENVSNMLGGFEDWKSKYISK